MLQGMGPVPCPPEGALSKQVQNPDVDEILSNAGGKSETFSANTIAAHSLVFLYPFEMYGKFLTDAFYLKTLINCKTELKLS